MTRARRPNGWMNRSFSAIVTELKFVEAGSLDVLLYCADDLVPSAPEEVEGERTA